MREQIFNPADPWPDLLNYAHVKTRHHVVRRELLIGEGDEEPALVEVLSSRRGPKALLMRLQGVGSREDAESLRGYTLCVPREALPELEEGEYYHADLIGLDAFQGAVDTNDASLDHIGLHRSFVIGDVVRFVVTATGRGGPPSSTKGARPVSAAASARTS